MLENKKEGETAINWFNNTLTANERTKLLLKYGLLGNKREEVVKSIKKIWESEVSNKSSSELK